MKKINKLYAIAGGTFVIGVLIGWLLFGRNSNTESEPHDHSLSAENESIWTCSMHPQIRQNEPGQCPICGMDLIPLESSEGGNIDPMAIAMSETAMKLAQVETMIVGGEMTDKKIKVNGKVQADERLRFTQSSHIPGRIERLLINFTGDYTKEGQTIAEVYSPELINAQRELLEAAKIRELQPALFNASKEKLKRWKLTDGQIESILTSGEISEQFPILANVSGYVTEKKVNLGDYIRQGEPLFEVENLSRVWVLFEIYESDLSWVKPGLLINYRVSSLPGTTFSGRISYVDPVIDSKSRVAKARIETINSNGKLKPEMFVSGEIMSSVRNITSQIMVPKSAVMWTGKRSVVYVMTKNVSGISFKMREVAIGPDLGDNYIIESGLNTGEEIAVNGTFSIDAAAQLAGKPSMMNPSGGAAMTGHNHGAMDMAEGNTSKTPASGSEDYKKLLSPLFEYYLSLTNALSYDDLQKSKTNLKALNENLGKINMTSFEGDDHSKWMKQSSAAKSTLSKMMTLNELGSIRKEFLKLSEQMIGMAESFHPYSQTLFVQFCPMANENRGGKWLSRKKEIENPYYGQSMLSCGETISTIE